MLLKVLNFPLATSSCGIVIPNSCSTIKNRQKRSLGANLNFIFFGRSGAFTNKQNLNTKYKIVSFNEVFKRV
jgi:hypothetical protein